MTSNRGLKEWGEVFGDNVIAAALLDRLLHRATVVEIAGNSYSLREHADLIPDSLKRGGTDDTKPANVVLEDLGKAQLFQKLILYIRSLGWGIFNWH